MWNDELQLDCAKLILLNYVQSCIMAFVYLKQIIIFNKIIPIKC